MENQADCISGDFTGWLDSEGQLDYPDNFLENIDLPMSLIASAEDGPGRTHRTLEERIDAFYLGYEQGIQAWV